MSRQGSRARCSPHGQGRVEHPRTRTGCTHATVSKMAKTAGYPSRGVVHSALRFSFYSPSFFPPLDLSGGTNMHSTIQGQPSCLFFSFLPASRQLHHFVSCFRLISPHSTNCLRPDRTCLGRGGAGRWRKTNGGLHQGQTICAERITQVMIIWI